MDQSIVRGQRVKVHWAQDKKNSGSKGYTLFFSPVSFQTIKL